ncbi:uncharacterized protein LOC122577002 isoform X1 [Bombus pyrosoma]|uniref:uncharacterized protein LOC122577002 isoform X1 n=1 Tax=Bombus pyrosoma TaxID=396416 RepID=UPI001CB993DE|nr:uncharacterized protein LOC122577002 isoform X1 [Bombus pyrosoma]
MIRNPAVPTFGSTVELTTSRLYLEFKFWRAGHLSEHGAECQSPYASLLSSRASALYVVLQNGYANYKEHRRPFDNYLIMFIQPSKDETANDYLDLNFWFSIILAS